MASIAIVAWFVWSGYSAKQSIRRVFREDAALPALVMKEASLVDKYWDSSRVVSDLATRMNKISLDGCPTDFQLAYKAHVSAWATLAQVKANSEGLNGFVKSFMSGGITALVGMSDQSDAEKKILASFAEVQRVAIEHGVAP